MSKYTIPSIWTDEFNKPKIEQLRDMLDADQKKVFDKARGKIMELGNIDEEVIWHGDCWFWCFSFAIEGDEDPLALIIFAEEEKGFCFQVASPLQEDFLDQLPTRRLKRFVRDGIELAMPPHQTNWAIWSVSTLPSVDDLLPVLKSKYKFYDLEDEE